MLLTPKIFILEDEETFILRFKIILQKIGISTQEFRPFKQGQHLIDFMQKEYPDIVFIDLTLKENERDGFEILTHVKQKYNGKLKAGIISSSEDIEDIKRAADAGARFYIVKTGNINVFSDRLTQFKKDFLEKDTKKFVIYK